MAVMIGSRDPTSNDGVGEGERRRVDLTPVIVSCGYDVEGEGFKIDLRRRSRGAGPGERDVAAREGEGDGEGEGEWVTSMD